ncbi:MAG: histidine--tRNA ligase [Bacteriovoracia bacterium]
MSNLSTQPYKGTRDFYPSEMRIRRWMFDSLRKTLNSFGYEEYDGPLLEPFELYAAKTSEEIVNEQLYWLVDRGERKLAIRPEMTPTLARMVAAKQNELAKPIRWFSIPNLWRYERPQRGRLREHWQLNVDVFGGSAFAEDLEICQISDAILKGFGAKSGYEVKINHRALTNFIFKNLANIDDGKIQTVGRLLDGAPKMGLEVFKTNLEKEGLNPQQIEVLLSLFSDNASKFLEEKCSKEASYQHLRLLFEHFEKLGIASVFKLDPSIMRGFLYYTGFVFEVYDTHPDNNRAMFGGGRYDNLVGMFGKNTLSGVGFGMGDVTLQNFLETHQLLPKHLDEPNGIYVGYLDDPSFISAQKLSTSIREKLSLRVLVGLSAEKPKKIFETAERHRARYVIMVGSQEAQSGRFLMKDLIMKIQHEGTLEDLIKELK